jgi:hypothetical protein
VKSPDVAVPPATVLVEVKTWVWQLASLYRRNATVPVGEDPPARAPTRVWSRAHPGSAHRTPPSTK